MSSAVMTSYNPSSANTSDLDEYPPGFRAVMTGNSRSPLANVRSLHSPRATMNISILSRLSFSELENLGIEKKNFDCAEVVSRYSDMGTDRVEESLGVEAIGIEADPPVACGWKTNGGGCWILADVMSMSLATLAKENLVSAS